MQKNYFFQYRKWKRYNLKQKQQLVHVEKYMQEKNNTICNESATADTDNIHLVEIICETKMQSSSKEKKSV